MNEFYQYYNDFIKQSLIRPEAERLQQYKLYKLFKNLQILMAFCVFISVCAMLLGFNFLRFLILLGVFVSLFLFFRNKKLKVADSYKLKIRIPVIKRVLAKWMQEITLARLSTFNENCIRIICGVNRKDTSVDFYAKKGVRGTFNGNSIEFFTAKKETPLEAKTEELNPGNGNFAEVFFGNLFSRIDSQVENKKIEYFTAASFQLHRNLNGKVFILPKHTPCAIGKYYSNIGRIKSHDDDVNEIYDIYTDSINLFKNLEDRRFFSSLKSLSRNVFGKPFIMIDNKLCTVVLETPNDICNFNIDEELDNGGKFTDISYIATFLFEATEKIEKPLE